MVKRESALSSATTPVAVANPADGALPILLVEKFLVLLGGMTLPPHLRVLVGHGKAVPAAVCAVGKPRKLFAHLLPPTALANRQAVANALVFDPMETLPDQVGSDDTKRRARPSGNFPDRETGAEQVSNLVHKRYLKRKQQRSLVAN